MHAPMSPGMSVWPTAAATSAAPAAVQLTDAGFASYAATYGAPIMDFLKRQEVRTAGERAH